MRKLIQVFGLVVLGASISLLSGCAVIGHAIDDAVWGQHHHHHKLRKRHHSHYGHKHRYVHQCD
jgi:hypothetical protein